MGSYQIVRSKMIKTNVLLADEKLARYVPKTELYSIENLKKMLKEFQRVYVKPDCGRGGNRVLCITTQSSRSYKIYYEGAEKVFEKMADVVHFIDEVADGDPFIIQKGIHLLCSGKSPFDLRVNVQKPYSSWEVTAMIAKVAEPGRMVTNYAQGSTLVDFEQALVQANLNSHQIGEITALLTKLGERTAVVLNEKFSGLRELGLDIALDQKAAPWILEVNTKPVFPKGMDKKFDRYRRIIRKKYR